MLHDPRIGNPTYHEQLEGKIKKKFEVESNDSERRVISRVHGVRPEILERDEEDTEGFGKGRVTGEVVEESQKEETVAGGLDEERRKTNATRTERRQRETLGKWVVVGEREKKKSRVKRERKKEPTPCTCVTVRSRTRRRVLISQRAPRRRASFLRALLFSARRPMVEELDAGGRRGVRFVVERVAYGQRGRTGLLQRLAT